MTWTGSATQSWNILATQIECGNPWTPPDGCLQWFTGSTGFIRSFNMPQLSELGTVGTTTAGSKLSRTVFVAASQLQNSINPKKR